MVSLQFEKPVVLLGRTVSSVGSKPPTCHSSIPLTVLGADSQCRTPVILGTRVLLALLNFTGRGWVRPSASPFPSPMLPGGLWPRYHVRPSSSHRCLGSGVFWNGARLVSVHPSQDRDGALAAAPILDTLPPAAPTKRPPAGLTAMVPPSRPFHRSAQERPGSRATMSGTPAPPSRSLRATWTEEVGSSVLGKRRDLDMSSGQPSPSSA